jgi:hypothetical protein
MTAASAEGIDEDQLRLQRSVEHFRRGRRAVPDRLWIRRDDPHGAPVTEPEVFYQVGMEPVRVDVMTSVAELEFESAWERRPIVDFDGESAGVLSREDVLLSKKEEGRPRDRKHVRRLRKPRE